MHETRAGKSHALVPLNLETHGAYKTGRDSGGIIEKALHVVHTRKEEIQDHSPCYTVSLIIPWIVQAPNLHLAVQLLTGFFLGEVGLASFCGVIFSVLDFCPHLIILSP